MILRALTLPLLLVIAAALRLYGLDWDDGFHLHPDERFIAIVADRIRLPGSLAAYFDTARSPLNPYNNGFEGFAYGTLPLFLARWLGELTGFAGYERIVILGRVLSALADVGTVALVFALGRRLYGTGTGLIAAVIMTFSVLDIQLAHFFTVDTFLTFFVAWSLLFAYRAWMTGRLLDLAGLGIDVGLAAACKISALTLLPLAALACVLPWPGRARCTLARSSANLALVGGCALLAYRLAEPYAFRGTSFFDLRPNPKFVTDMLYWIRISSGEIDVPYMIQWAHTPKYILVLQSLVQWGLGPAAGAAALIGLGLTTVRVWRSVLERRHLLLVLWAVLNLVYFGGQFAKFMRYLLPAYPALAILAAFAVVTGWRWGRERLRSVGLGWSADALAAALPALVLLPTALWALAFASIYSRPNTRVAASAWLVANVPAGATLAVEHWDDALPLPVPGAERKRFVQVSMNLYDDEQPRKLTELLANLERADYIILASNRLYGSIPRLPQRYPLATEYYRALFDGRLGFEKVAEFTSRPQVLGITIVDDEAQEDFTVYDHPKVQIFKRGPGYDQQRVAALLGAVRLDQVQRVKAADADQGPPPVLSPAEWAQARSGGTWSALFHRDDLANRFASLVWLLVAVCLGLVAWPVLWCLTPHLLDGGYGLSRVFGLVLVAYGAWLAASAGIAPFQRSTLVAAGLGLAALSALILARRGTAFLRSIRGTWPLLLAAEAAFAAGFVICLWMRLVNPDLWHPVFGGEKPMDFAYLNAVVKSDSFPPYDPWFAGGWINYYYFGFVLVAALLKLTGIVPSVAYNLALALWMGLVAQAAFSVASNLACHRRAPGRRLRGPIAAGGLAAGFVVLAGNLDAVIQTRDALWQAGGSTFQSGIPLLAGLVRTAAGVVAVLQGARLGGFDFWRSTRLIGPEDPGPITEFPFFTFLYGDLHAHLLALPVTLLVCGLAVEVVRSAAWRRWLYTAGPLARPPLAALGRYLALAGVLGLGVGALRATNTWDFPTYTAVALAAFAVLFRPLRSDQLGRATFAVAISGALVVGASTLLFAPYLAHYRLFYSGVEPSGARTALGQFLTINGVWLFFLTSWLLLELGRRARPVSPLHSAPPQSYRFYGLALPLVLDRSRGAGLSLLAGVVLAAVLALALAGWETLALLAALAGGLGGVIAARWRARETVFVASLALLALAVLALPEVVAIKGDVGRMNTVFKFYFQAWTLLAVASAVWLVRLAPLGRWRWPALIRWRSPWRIAATALIAATLIYPLRGAPARLALRFEPLPPTLDGMAYMQWASYRDRERDAALPADYAAIRWLQDNVAGSPVILEANTGLYKWGSRISIYTGLPTVVGWDWHQKQQRVAMADQVDERVRDVRTIYNTPRLDEALRLLGKYDVAYIYVGGLERIYYTSEGLRKFEEAPDTVLEPIYRNASVTIYRVRGAS